MGKPISAFVFPNDGQLDSSAAKQFIIDKNGSFQEQAQACYHAVYGIPTENSARLFDDYGVELTSFTCLGVDEDLLLVVTNGEDFQRIDYRKKFVRESGHLGLIQEDELSDFVTGLGEAIAIDAALASPDEDATDYKLDMDIWDDLIRSLDSVDSPAASAFSSSATSVGTSVDTLLTPAGDATLFTSVVESTHTRPRAELEDEVLSSMAQLDIGPLPEEAVLPLLERLAPPTLDDAVAARAEAASAAQARLPHIDMLEIQMESCEDMDTAELLSMLSDDEVQGADVTNTNTGTSSGEAGSGDTKRDRIREADRRYRRKLRGDIGQLKSVIRPHVEDMPKLPRAALFNRVGEYIQTAMQANRNLAAENEELYRELEQSREMLLTQRRTLQHRTVGIIIGQLVAPSQKNARLWPRDVRKPFVSRMIFWNHVMELMTGYQSSEVLGLAPIEALGFYRNPYVKKSHYLMLKKVPDPMDMSAFPFKFPMVFQRKDGALMSMVSYISPIRNPETKHPTHFVMWLTQFRPFVPANSDSQLHSTP